MTSAWGGVIWLIADPAIAGAGMELGIGLGTGPVKGFAITLSFGLFANLFTAVFVSRHIFDSLLKRKQRGEALSIG